MHVVTQVGMHATYVPSACMSCKYYRVTPDMYVINVCNACRITWCGTVRHVCSRCATACSLAPTHTHVCRCRLSLLKNSIIHVQSVYIYILKPICVLLFHIMLYKQVCAYTCMHACMHTYVHPSIHPSMHACMHACIRTYVHACMHIYSTYIDMHVHIHTGTHAWVSIYIYIYTDTHTHMYTCFLYAYTYNTHTRTQLGQHTLFLSLSRARSWDEHTRTGSAMCRIGKINAVHDDTVRSFATGAKPKQLGCWHCRFMSRVAIAADKVGFV